MIVSLLIRTSSVYLQLRFYETLYHILDQSGVIFKFRLYVSCLCLRSVEQRINICLIEWTLQSFTWVFLKGVSYQNFQDSTLPTFRAYQSRFRCSSSDYQVVTQYRLRKCKIIKYQPIKINCTSQYKQINKFQGYC